MANPDIQLMGATYQAVSGVTLPVAGGGTATFPFVEGSQNITQNGTVDVTSLAQVIVNVAGGGGGGLTYETGTFSPAADITRPTISFANSHSTRPFYAVIFDTGNAAASKSTSLVFSIINWYDYDGTTIFESDSSQLYAILPYMYKTSTGSSASSIRVTSVSGNTNTSIEYSLTNANFKPTLTTGVYFRSGRTYKWIAVWKPTT